MNEDSQTVGLSEERLDLGNELVERLIDRGGRGVEGYLVADQGLLELQVASLPEKLPEGNLCPAPVEGQPDVQARPFAGG